MCTVQKKEHVCPLSLSRTVGADVYCRPVCLRKLVSVVWPFFLFGCRLYHVYKRLGMISSFGDLLSNIFEPLFEVVRNPNADPDLFTFISMVSRV